jgi:hypothetical protein
MLLVLFFLPAAAFDIAGCATPPLALHQFPGGTLFESPIVFTKLENVHHSKDSTFTEGITMNDISYKQRIE